MNLLRDAEREGARVLALQVVDPMTSATQILRHASAALSK